jgi:hypothetical protein
MNGLSKLSQAAGRLPRGLSGLVLGRRVADEKLTIVAVGDTKKGKSSWADEVIRAVESPASPRLPIDIRVAPGPDLERRHVPGYPPRTGAAVLITGTARLGRRHVPLELIDLPGEYLRFTAGHDDGDPQAREFFEMIHRAEQVLLFLDMADLLERPAAERDDLHLSLAHVAAEAAAQARAEGRPCHASVVYAKRDECAADGIGSPRLIGNRPEELRALCALQSAPEGQARARLAEFVEVVAADPTATPEGRALRRRLVEASAALWYALVRCQALDPHWVGGYFIQARPVELAPWRRESVERRGVLHPLHDFLQTVRDRNASPRVRPWAVAAGVLLVVGSVFAGVREAARVASAREYLTSQVRAGYALDPKRTPYDADDLERRGLAGPVPPGDLLAPHFFGKLLNAHYADFAVRAREARAGTIGLDDLAAARARLIDWEGLYAALPPRARAAFEVPGSALRPYADDFKSLEDSLQSAEIALIAYLRHVAEAAGETGLAGPADGMTRVEALERERLAVIDRLRATRAAVPPGRGFLAETHGGALAVRSVAADIVAPWCDAAERFVGAGRDDTARLARRLCAARPAEYAAWLRNRRDAQTAFLAALDPTLPLDPYRRDFFAAVPGFDINPSPRTVSLAAEPVYAYLRVRYRPAGSAEDRIERVYDIDLETAAVYPVQNGEPGRVPLALEAGTLLGSADSSDTCDWGRGTRLRWAPADYEVIGAWIKAGKNGPFQPLTFRSRGDESLWLPALAAGLAEDPARCDPALTVAGADSPGLAHEWVRFFRVVKQLAGPDPFAAPADQGGPHAWQGNP